MTAEGPQKLIDTVQVERDLDRPQQKQNRLVIDLVFYAGLNLLRALL